MDGYYGIKRERGDNDHFLSFIEYMKPIKHHAKGFVYEFCRDSNSKIVGVAWMTATMRRNFELFWIIHLPGLHEEST